MVRFVLTIPSFVPASEHQHESSASKEDETMFAAEYESAAAPEPADPLLHRARARLGTTLREKWRLDRLLGVGGAAAVYAVTHRNGSRAAVKILHPEMSTSAFVRERFLSEGYVANAVVHDGVVKVIDDDTAEDGSPFLVTELLDGETLEATRRAAPTAASTVPTSRPDCLPPYVIEVATGKKRWMIGCL
jgi:serine/threonine protein kinase